MYLGVIFLTVSSLLFTLINCDSPFPVKHLAGPPSDFENHRVPDPSLIITDERSGSYFIWFQSAKQVGSDVIYTEVFPVDGPTQFMFTFASPHEANLQLELTDPQGKIVDLSLYLQKSFFSLGSDYQVPASAYIIPDSAPGFYTLQIKSTVFNDDDLEELSESSYPNAVLTILNNDYVEIQSHLSSYVIKSGEEIGIISTIIDLTPTAALSNIQVTYAMLEVITPEGQDVQIQMSDEDPILAKFGVPPHSGVYAGKFSTQSSGEFILQALLKGQYTDESSHQVPFLRSTEHIIEVSSATLSLTGSSSVRPIDGERVAVDIQTTGTGDKLRAYAEVWGVDMITNEPKAACWIGGVVEVVNNAVTLELNLNWLILAGVKAPLTLQNVYVSDLTTSYPVAVAVSDMRVEYSEQVIHISTHDTNMVITKEMRQGRNPLKVDASVAAAAPNLLILPGYCSSKNPFQSNANAFTDAAFFTIGGANLGHQTFSERAMAYAQSLGMQSYSIIGHSQGGMVGLHMHNYYFTGMDTAVGSRLIQSVGTPYQGCTAAGSLANLGKIFGVACGSNNDLSLDGAANWLTGIAQESRKEVNYYTTTYKQGNLFGDSCSLAMNLVLQWPNDGTTEFKFATLTHATNLGNKEKWCHIESMNYPPQCTDSARNVEMNEMASR